MQGCQTVYFRTKKHQLESFWEGLGTEKFGILNAILEYITALWYILSI
jgi:hypothetical protein